MELKARCVWSEVIGYSHILFVPFRLCVVMILSEILCGKGQGPVISICFDYNISLLVRYAQMQQVGFDSSLWRSE